MELLTILNENEEVIGEKDIKKIYKDGDIHYTVHIFIINDKNEILLQKRNKNKETFPGLWAISAAGHVKAKEEPIDACIRELKEELDQNIKSEELEYLFTVRRKDEQNGNKINTFDKIYLLRKNIKDIKIQKEELSKTKYVPLIEYKKSLNDEDKAYVPKGSEHDRLFDLLIPLSETTTEYTYELYKDLAVYTERHSLKNYSMPLIILILGIALKGWFFYFSFFIAVSLLLTIDQRAIKKAQNLYKIIGTDKTHKEKYIFYKDHFQVNKSKIAFNQLYKIVKRKNVIYLFINKKQAFIVENNPTIVL